MRHQRIGGEHASNTQSTQPRDRDPRDAVDQQHRAEGEHHERGLAEVRLGHQQADEADGRHKGDDMAGKFRPPRVIGEKPGHDDDEARLRQLRGLEIDRPDIDPAVGALDFGPEEQRRDHQHQRSGKHQEPGAPGETGREEG